MFRDAEEELQRLEQQLLEEEEQDQTPLEEEDYDQFLPEEEVQTHGPMVYRNFSNDYGKNLRNYATGYKAYNTDKVDEDLERFSEEVHSGKKDSPVWLLAVLLALMAVVAAVVAWIYLGMGGLF